MSNITSRHRVTTRITAITFVLAMAMGLTVSSGSTAHAAENDWTWTTTGTSATITSYTGTDTEVVVPEQLDGMPVTAIGDHVFHGATWLTAIELPPGLTSIGHTAFMGAGISQIDLPVGLRSIGPNAFAHTDLTSVTLPEGLDIVSTHAFYGAKLEWAVIPDSLDVTPGAPDWEQTSPGRDFAGWFFADGQPVGSDPMPMGGGTIYTHWTPEPVVLHPNGTDVDMSGLPAATTYGTPTRPHHDFLGWSLEQNPIAGTTLIAGSEVRATGRGIELYAQWAPTNYDVTLHANDGSGAVTVSSFSHGSVVRFGVRTRPDARFLGWAQVAFPSGSDPVIAGDEDVTVTGDMELFAQWAPATMFATVVDKDDGDQNVDAADAATLFSTVTYADLNVGTEYTAVAAVIDPALGQAVLDPRGDPVQSTFLFTPDSPHGQVQFDTTVSAGSFAGVSAFTVVHTLLAGSEEVASFGATSDTAELVTFSVTAPDQPPLPVDPPPAPEPPATTDPATTDPATTAPPTNEAAAAAPTPDSLPVTGFSDGALALVAGVLLIAGLALTRLRRSAGRQ